ncbi:hypothetical protein BARVI_07890 [Barnesiella viscericola DSM 18177]|uniref:Uncharacterized protein n=1 Tax=Barnesiella viscericola DSM 18177 TaxID=880074 RepID=W0EXA5_9BACT|nr:hypothetical protein BARVI_07890 [Barnesiella viscericola DSM 18177]
MEDSPGFILFDNSIYFFTGVWVQPGAQLLLQVAFLLQLLLQGACLLQLACCLQQGLSAWQLAWQFFLQS